MKHGEESELKMTQGDFKIALKGNELYIQIIECLSSKLWADKWGKIEEKISRGRFSGNPFNSIRMSFADCLWADPLPLLSILMLLVKEHKLNKVTVVLPCFLANDIKKENYKKGQFLKYLATQGFLRIMVDNFWVVDAKGRKIGERNIVQFAEYKNSTFYGEVEILQAQIYDVANIHAVKEFVLNLQNEMSVNLRSQLSLAVYYSINTQIYNILTELIDNVSAHAYTDDQQKLFGIYIRKRCGVINNYRQKSYDFMKALSFEQENCPALGMEILEGSESLLEIFFLDLGIGISGSLKESFLNIKKEKCMYPVRELFCRVLKDGERSKGSKAVTAYGGLHFITRIIRENKGYIWFKDSNEWVGAYCSDIINGDRGRIKNAVSNTKTQPSGLGWGFRLPYTDDLENVYLVSHSWEGKASFHPVFQEYKNRDFDFTTDYLVMIDEWENGRPVWVIPGNINGCVELGRGGKISGKYRNFVWRPRAGNSKNQIIDLLKKYINEVIVKIAEGFEDVNIYITDIDSSEILTYFYTFNNLSLSVLEYYYIDRIILITKQWGVTCFKNNQNLLLYDIELSKEYVCIRKSSNKDLSVGICQMANFQRKYDSWLFWKKLKEMQNERVFINGEVEWTSGKTVRGYLDLDRLYLYEELYNKLKNVLVRLSGLEKNSMAEYRSIDVTSSRICRELNTSLVYREDGRKFVMNIAGVCASGYTKESFYGEQKVDITFAFFAHPSFNKEFKDTAYLLVWPKEEYFDCFEPDNRLYKRMGQTNLISINQQERLINVDSIYSNSIRDKRQSYEDFQQKYPKAVKYGHFQTDRHHYLIGIDINSYIQYSHMKRDGVFLFLLAKVLFYLADSPETLNMYIKNLADSSWEKALKNYNYDKFGDKGELIVYHSNTYTEYAMKFLRKIIPASLDSRIIPINFLDVQSKGTPIAFSPFILERIKEHYTAGQTGILYIDSSLYTGRSLVELENILLSAGCGEVSFSSFVDMRRLRNADYRSQSYWKLNIPRLDNKSQCIVCNTLNIIKHMDHNLKPEARKRVQEWIKNWQYISIKNNIKGHGIESSDKHNEILDGIKISSTIGLNMYAAEHMCESFDDDFVYNLIQKKTDLSPENKLQLISTQLCLFGNQNSRQLQLSLLRELVGNMAKLKKVSPYTSLAALMLISQNTTTMYELLNEILYLNDNKDVQSIKRLFLQSVNMDLAIVVGYFIRTDNNIEAILSSYSDENKSTMITFANGFYLPDRDLKLISKTLLGLCVNEQGSSHNVSLEKLKEEHVTKVSDFVDCCTFARSDLQSIKELAKHFPLSMASNYISDRFSYPKLVRDIDETERLMDLDIDAHERREIHEGDRIDSSKELQDSIEKCKADLDILLSNYFVSTSEETEKYFQKMCMRYEQIHKKKIIFHFSSPGLEHKKWYYWNSGMEKEFGYFLDNLKHCKRPIDFSECANEYMDVEARFDINSLTLTIKSWSCQPALEVERKFLEENRLSKENSEAFDVNFCFTNIIARPAEQEYLLETKMEVPSCYQSLKEKAYGRTKEKI